MSDKNHFYQFDWSFVSVVKHAIMWLLKVLAPTAAAAAIMLLCYFQSPLLSSAACVLACAAGLFVIPFAFSFERTGIIGLDVVICIITEAFVFVGLILVQCACFPKASPFHSVSYSGVICLGWLYSLLCMIFNFFVTREKQNGLD